MGGIEHDGLVCGLVVAIDEEAPERGVGCNELAKFI